MLTRAVLEPNSADSSVAWTCRRFGIPRQRDWPVAAILAEAAGDRVHGKYWLCIDPGHLAVERDHLVLTPAARLNLSDRESEELHAFLAPQFAADSLRLVRIDAMRWCISSDEPVRVTTCDFESAVGSDINALLPQGEDAAHWLRLLTEAQMLLHTHPVNVNREARGAPAINSLWLWGGGVKPHVSPANVTVAACDPFLSALAKLSSARCVELPDGLSGLIDDLSAGDTLVAPDFGLGAGNAEQLQQLEAHWVEPAWAALCRGIIDEFRLAICTVNGVSELAARRSTGFQFWRRAVPLARALARIGVKN